MDPQQRLLYEVAEQALQDAGYMGNGKRVGCFIGVATGDYAEVRVHVTKLPLTFRTRQTTSKHISLLAHYVLF